MMMMKAGEHRKRYAEAEARPDRCEANEAQPDDVTVAMCPWMEALRAKRQRHRGALLGLRGNQNRGEGSVRDSER